MKAIFGLIILTASFAAFAAEVQVRQVYALKSGLDLLVVASPTKSKHANSNVPENGHLILSETTEVTVEQISRDGRLVLISVDEVDARGENNPDVNINEPTFAWVSSQQLQAAGLTPIQQ